MPAAFHHGLELVRRLCIELVSHSPWLFEAQWSQKWCSWTEISSRNVVLVNKRMNEYPLDCSIVPRGMSSPLKSSSSQTFSICLPPPPPPLPVPLILFMLPFSLTLQIILVCYPFRVFFFYQCTNVRDPPRDFKPTENVWLWPRNASGCIYLGICVTEYGKTDWNIDLLLPFSGHR